MPEFYDSYTLGKFEPESAEIQIERRADFICRELKEMAFIAADPETADLIQLREFMEILDCCLRVINLRKANDRPTFKVNHAA